MQAKMLMAVRVGYAWYKNCGGEITNFLATLVKVSLGPIYIYQFT
jgi:hypothetical protein